MELAQFSYHLPPELIAQEPVEPRDSARLLVVERARAAWHDQRVNELPQLLTPGDCLVVNRSKVIPARLPAFREADGRPVEILMLRAVGPTRWEALVRPGRRCRVGARLVVGAGAGRLSIVAEGEEGARVVDVESPWPVPELLDRYGLPPLPPYIERHHAPKPEDRERYQTVYAREEGSIAAPTAGLHFTDELIRRLESVGIELHAVTLHVGAGTFRPLRAERVEDHRLAPEDAEVSEDTACAVNRAKAEGRRVIAVGTTTTRTLEWAADGPGRIRARRGVADLFIYPGYPFSVIDGLMTNFHLPRSSVLLLASAFCGRELVLRAYDHAIAARYRFYSFGDAMLIV